MIYYNEEVKFQLVVNLDGENDMVKEYMSDYLYVYFAAQFCTNKIERWRE